VPGATIATETNRKRRRMAEILYADDDEAFRELVRDFLESIGHRVRVVTGGAEALAEVRAAAPDVVLLDYRMGEPDGMAVCRTIKSDPRFGHIPVLILTGEGSIDHRLEGFDAGADDYLAKPVDGRELAARIRALLELSRRGLDRNPSSRLPGGEAIRRDFERRRDRGHALAVCHLDLDNFKPFGDRFGFPVSDAVIGEVGGLLQELAERSDVFAGHIGGDDFIVLCPPEDARAYVTQVREDLRQRLVRILPPEVVATGSYVGLDRSGETREFPLTSLSAAILRLPPGFRRSLQDLGEIIADVKGRAKRSPDGVEEVEVTGE
jgi:PleD family two-component response regulator